MHPVRQPRFSSVYAIYSDKSVWLPYTHVGKREQKFSPTASHDPDLQKCVDRLQRQAREQNIPFAELTLNMSTNRGYSLLPLRVVYTDADAVEIAPQRDEIQGLLTEMERNHLALKRASSAAWKARYTRVCYESRTTGFQGFINWFLHTKDYEYMRRNIEPMDRKAKMLATKVAPLENEQQKLVKKFEATALPVLQKTLEKIQGYLPVKEAKKRIIAKSFEVASGGKLSEKPSPLKWHWFAYPNNSGWLTQN